MTRTTTDILDSNSNRTTGKSALFSNIEAALAVSEIVKTTLGPMGMDKMLIDSVGRTVITNDGVKILKEMEIEHPGAKMLVDVARTQEEEVGDGTTTAVLYSGELLKSGKNLLEKKIHPTLIIKSYKRAVDFALKVLDKNSIKVDTSKKKLICDIANTAMVGKVVEHSRDILSQIIYKATLKINSNSSNLREQIKIAKATGGNVEESFLVDGVVLEKEFANEGVNLKQKDAKVLLIDFPLEIQELDSEAKININSLEEYNLFLKEEENQLKNLVLKIKEIGCSVVFCQKGVDEQVSFYLANEGIAVCRRVRKSDMKKLKNAVSAKIISSKEEIKSENLGYAGLIEQREIFREKFIFVEKCKNPQTVTLFLKAATNHVLDEIERAVEDALGDIFSIFSSKKIVAGGGAIELELYRELLSFAKKFEGKEQLIISEFANSFLVVPKVLCENCGLDEISTIAKLISLHEKKYSKAGIDGFDGVVEDTLKNSIIEPINVKLQAIKSATETASMILRIDDIIAAKKLDVSKANLEEF